MKILFIINDPPYGTEGVYNALRLAHALLEGQARGIDDAGGMSAPPQIAAERCTAIVGVRANSCIAGKTTSI
jgi:hypothetical protein